MSKTAIMPTAKSHLFMLCSPCQFRLSRLNQKSEAVVAEGLRHPFRHLSAELVEFPVFLHQCLHLCPLQCQFPAVVVSECRRLHLRHIQPRMQR
jgi:hypothetical protein